jgi:Undecaprenyl-phosphate galactose phosphotransferase WbaP
MRRRTVATSEVGINPNLLNPWNRRVKRALDLFGAVVGGLATSPLWVLIAIVVKLDSAGPVYFSQYRVGIQGKQFRCWKFRTMVADAERSIEEILQSDPNLRAEWEQTTKLRYDPRITRVGRFLRKSSLDELPQLWNVFRGEMSLVGPRPLIEWEAPLRSGASYELYKLVKPGITGLWQVSGRNDTSYASQVALDSHYVRNWSVWLDLMILTRTVSAVLLGRGAY